MFLVSFWIGKEAGRGLRAIRNATLQGIFHQRGIEIDQLPPANDNRLPLNEEAEVQRAA
jgi:hypothetical protein